MLSTFQLTLMTARGERRIFEARYLVGDPLTLEDLAAADACIRHCLFGFMRWRSRPTGATLHGRARRGAEPEPTCRRVFRIWSRSDRATPGRSPPDNRLRSSPARY